MCVCIAIEDENVESRPMKMSEYLKSEHAEMGFARRREPSMCGGVHQPALRREQVWYRTLATRAYVQT